MRNVLFRITAYILTGAVAAALLLAIRQLPTPASVQAAYTSTDRAILDRNGQILDEVRGPKDDVRRLNWVPLRQVPQSFVEAVLSAEDRRFHYHFGFEPHGGDTVTMQLARMLAPSQKLTRTEVIVRAVALEMAWKKREILEAYINLVHYRGELQGVAAASFALFDKAPLELSRAEGAVLAALIHAPAASIPEVRRQACHLLSEMGTPEECGALTLGHLAYLELGYRIRPFVSLAPFVAARLAAAPEFARSSLVRSTLDRQLQWKAMHALSNAGDVDGGVLVVENASGNVLAYASSLRTVDTVAALRPADKALAPLIFAQALDERVLTLPLLKDDSPLTAVHALDELGVENFVPTLKGLGFSRLERPDVYGPSVALGFLDVPLPEIANAYRTLANQGEWSPLRYSPDEISEFAARRVFSAQAAFLLTTHLMQRPGEHWRAVRAGRTTVGYSAKYTVAVVGELALWENVMDALQSPDEDSEAPLVPPGLIQVDNQWFIKGTEPREGPEPSHITYPRNFAQLSWDEEFSRANPRLFIQVASPQADQNLYLNGRRLGRALPLLPWDPQAGRFVLELRDSRGHVVHKVHFEIRARHLAGA